jgi:putative peptidoglycan lipid II flippase
MTEAESAAGGLVRSSGVMAAGTAISRVLGFARNAVVVAALGTGLTADTFNVANTVPNIIYILLAGGVLNSVFVPQLVRAMRESDRGQAYSDRLLTIAGLVLLAITVVATAAAPLVITIYTPGDYSHGDVAVATTFAFWCLPQIFFYGVYTMVGQVLNARGSFGPMMWAPIVNNLVAITTGLAFLALFRVDGDEPSSLSDAAIAFLGIGTTLGVALQALVLLPVLARTGYRYRPRLDLRGSGLGHAANLAKWTLLFVLVNQIAYAVIVNLAAAAGKAAADQELPYGVGFTAYSNAYLTFILPHSIVTVSVVTGLLPRMSAAAAAGRLTDVRDELSAGWRLTAVGIVPATAGFVALGPQLTGVLFGFGRANAEGAHYIGLVLAAFAVGMPVFSAQYVALRGFYALEDTRTPFLLQVAIASTNVVLALAAYAVLPLRWRVVGLAFSYSLTYIVGLVLSSAVLRRRVGGLDGTRVGRTYVRLAVAAGPPAVAGWALAHLVGSVAGPGLAGSLAALAAGGAVLAGGYFLLARVLHIEEIALLLRAVGLGAPRL